MPDDLDYETRELLTYLVSYDPLDAEQVRARRSLPSLETIAHDMGCSRPHVRDLVREARARGFEIHILRANGKLSLGVPRGRHWQAVRDVARAHLAAL